MSSTEVIERRRQRWIIASFVALFGAGLLVYGVMEQPAGASKAPSAQVAR